VVDRIHGNNFITFIKNMFFLQLFLIVIIAGIGIDFAGIRLTWSEVFNKSSYKVTIPALRISSEMAVDFVAANNVALAGQSNIMKEVVTHIAFGIPENLVAANLNIPISPTQPVSLHNLTTESQEYKLPLEQKDPIKYEGKFYNTLKEYKVFLYCTHTSECYIPDSGIANRKDGERGLITQVAYYITEYLQKGGIQAQFIDRIHDYPDYNKSYTNSRETVKDIINSEKNLAALFDIHRDHIPDADSAETININGHKAARILIIAGTDERKEHPHWKENLDFAERLYQKGEQMYPGLIKGIRTRAGTYNQEFFDHALLLELGTDLNSLDEVQYAGALFAQVVLEVLEEEVK
jgi:stage II sporulation protein P